MPAIAAVREGRVLTDERRAALRRFAILIVVGATVFTGVAIAIKIPVLAPFPGTGGDPVMRAMTYTLMSASLILLFKVPEALLLGPMLERRIGKFRPVKLRHVFGAEIRWMAIWGGVLQMVYTLMFIGLVTVLAPTALASARACVIFSIVGVELFTRVLKPGKRKLRWWVRLTTAVVVTLGGAATVIFADGFHLFEGESGVYMWVFVALIGPGNFLLALAESSEFSGVHMVKTSAAIYTLARFVYFVLATVVSIVLWGLINGGWGVFWATIQMCLDRWYYLLPQSALAGLADMGRITVKTVIPASFMYVIGALAVAVEAVIQSVAQYFWPDTYVNVPGTWQFFLTCLGGGLVMIVGVSLFPHPKKKELQAATA